MHLPELSYKSYIKLLLNNALKYSSLSLLVTLTYASGECSASFAVVEPPLHVV